MEGCKTLQNFEFCLQLVHALSKRFPSPCLLLLSYVNTVDLATLKLIANKHPPLSSSPHPVGPSASSANYSIGRTNHALLQTNFRPTFLLRGKNRVQMFSQFDLDFRNISWTGEAVKQTVRRKTVQIILPQV
jgi:hypothetical protein